MKRFVYTMMLNENIHTNTLLNIHSKNSCYRSFDSKLKIIHESSYKLPPNKKLNIIINNPTDSAPIYITGVMGGFIT